MINKQSDDPNVEEAASHAEAIINEILNNLRPADSYDYGGHYLKVGEYDVCEYCTKAIAEAQQAHTALAEKVKSIVDPVVKEHLVVVSELFKQEAGLAILRAELHNGHGTERILNRVLEFDYDRNINESYEHSHHQGK